MLYKEIPFLQLTFALAAGIVTGSLAPAGQHFIGPVVALLAIAFIIMLFFLLSDRLKILSLRGGMAVFLTLYMAGIILFQSSVNRLVTISPNSSVFILRAEDAPEARERSVRLPVKIIAHGNTDLAKYSNRMMLYFRDTTGLNRIHPGTHIIITLSPRLINDPDTTDSFDYAEYMARKGYRYFAFAGKEFTLADGPPGMKNRAARLRKKLITILSGSSLSGENLALTTALTLGYRDLLNEEVTENFRRSGITHILAVSGLHVGILSLIMMSLLSFLKGRAVIIRVIISVAAIWVFAFITGLSPSVTRAAFMFSFLHAGKLVQRPVNNINSLLASAFVVLIINPTVIFEAGFQLSYSAVIFILLFYQTLYNSITVKGVLVRKIWSMTVITLLAQLGTLPFVIYYFHSLPVMSFFTNIIAIPSAFIILAGGLTSILTFPLPFIQLIASAITGKAAGLLINLADKVSSLPFSTFETGNTSLPLFISLLLLVPLATSFFIRKDSVHPHLLLASAIITIIASAA